ncbi:hypothetical protein AB0H57_00360 [Micromonospora sp. NPDC050686]|uniref:hypothetical protein n=1 Tax=Micromonospora sp. NPDC050686 TaxID=3154631 RepID=UPI0033D4E570
MGLDAVLYRVVRAGSSGRRSSYVPVQVVSDDDEVLLGLLARVRGGGRTPLLDRLDPVRDAVVVPEQGAQLLAELRCLVEVAGSQRETDRIRALAALTRRCLRERDAEIRFEGD